jgi:uncharacterized protein (TIGR03790 family)
MKHIFFTIVFLFILPLSVFALQPDEVVVLVNRNEKDGLALAKYYMEQRHIPRKNLLQVTITTDETCSRSEYEEAIITPVKHYLTSKKNQHIRCIVSFYGLPIRIDSPGLTSVEENMLKSLHEDRLDLETMLMDSAEDEKTVLQEKLTKTEARIQTFKKSTDKVAAFDSELTLIKTTGYNLGGWLPNPHYLQFQDAMTLLSKDDVLMTARLDGPDPTDVRRIIDETLMAEESGLSGTACFDARWQNPGDAGLSGYTLYDYSIHQAYKLVKAEGSLNTLLEETTALFQEGECADTALYSGWYSLGNYVDAFDWQPGSVGYHIASQECETLKKAGSQVWCKRMIEDGVAATIGPVCEPYVQAFPPPDIFFKYLVDGKHTLAEAYLKSIPYLSWKMVLLGDPLYRVNLQKKSSQSE